MTHSLRTFLAAAALSATAAVAPVAAAQADAPWSAPAPLQGATIQSTPLGTITARGTAALTYALPSTEANPAPQPTRLVRTDAAGNVLAGDGLSFAAQKAATYGATGIAVAGETLGTAYPGTLDDTSTLQVATMSGTGAIRTTTIGGLQGFGADAIAGDAKGNLALLVFNTRERIVYLRAKGSSSFKKVLTIPVSSQGRGATLTLGGRSGGEILVAYEDRHTIYARHRGTRSWGSVHQLGDGIQSDISAAFDASGRESVAWKSQRVGEGQSHSPAVVSFSTAAPGKGFGLRRAIDSVSGPNGSGHYVASPGVLLRVVDATHTLMAWTGATQSGRFGVATQTISSGHTGTVTALTSDQDNAILGDTAVTPSGAALILWRRNVEGADTESGRTAQVDASYRAAGAAAFGQPEPISPAVSPTGPNGDTVQPPLALLDPATGRAIAAWTTVSGPPQFSVRPAN